MPTFDEMKNKWENAAKAVGAPGVDENAIEKIVRARTRREKNTVMKYFWASFALQIIVYALLSHVIIRFGSDVATVLMAVCGIVIFVPFTITLLKKFKAMAINKPNGNTSLHQYVLRQYDLLKSFYRFKKAYEMFLIPLSTAIGTFLVFQLYFPGGAMAHVGVMIWVFVITLVSCGYAIYRENRKYFRDPLSRLESVLEEFSQ